MDVDELFGLPLDEFIPERTALAKSLRAEGRRDEAKEVAATRKPSVAAWAVNQLVRTQGATAGELFDAGDALRAAQDEVLAGKGDRTSLREAADRERQAVDELINAARGLLTSGGQELSPAVIERVGETLHAAALDDDARQQVRNGTLQHELRHVGFGAGAGAGTPAPPSSAPTAPTKKRAAKGKPTPKQDKDRTQQREARRQAERERAAAVKAARATEGDARRAAQRAARALELAQERRDRAADALDHAETELEQARAQENAAAEAQQTAAAELDRLTQGAGGS